MPIVNMERFNEALDGIAKELRQLTQAWPTTPNHEAEVICISRAEGILNYMQQRHSCQCQGLVLRKKTDLMPITPPAD